jgi:hypothetical protein
VEDASAAASAGNSNSMKPDVNPRLVSGRSQPHEHFVLARNGLFRPRLIHCYLYTQNIPCYKWTCSASGSRLDVSQPGTRKSSPENAILKKRDLKKMDAPGLPVHVGACRQKIKSAKNN